MYLTNKLHSHWFWFKTNCFLSNFANHFRIKPMQNITAFKLILSFHRTAPSSKETNNKTSSHWRVKTVSDLWNDFLLNNTADSIKNNPNMAVCKWYERRGRDQYHFLFLSIHSIIYSKAQNWVWFPHGFPSCKSSKPCCRALAMTHTHTY